MTTRQVEEFSRLIAEERQNAEFLVSNAWLTQLENHNCVPSVYKLYSLSAAYRVPFRALLKMFGIDLDAKRDGSPLSVSGAAPLETFQDEGIAFSVNHEKFTLEATNLVQHLSDLWGDIPWQILPSLGSRHCPYGFVGTKDYTMFPLIRPGSLVEIDDRVRQPQVQQWRREFDRPIYFVELRQAYACSWCELRGALLTLIPHPLSGCQLRQYAYPSEAEIIGQVVGVAMRLFSPDSSAPLFLPGASPQEFEEVG